MRQRQSIRLGLLVSAQIGTGYRAYTSATALSQMLKSLTRSLNSIWAQLFSARHTSLCRSSEPSPTDGRASSCAAV